MKDSTFTLEGSNLSTIVDSFRISFSPFEYVSQSKDTIIFVLEEYKFLPNHDIVATVILDFKSEYRCTVTIVVAGGRGGWIRMDIYRTEKSLLDRITRFFQLLAKERGVTQRFPSKWGP